MSRRQFWEVIQKMSAEGVTVFVTTHHLDEAEFCNRLALIDCGKLIALGTPTELKRDSLQGCLMLLECDQLWRTVELVKNVKGVRDAVIFGSALHLLLDDKDAAGAEVRGVLQMAGIQIIRFEAIRPSLEDVFVELTAGNSDAAG